MSKKRNFHDLKLDKRKSLHILDDGLSGIEKLKKRQNMLGVRADKLFTVGFDVNRVSATNCENLVGSVEIPVGVVGPVSVKESNCSLNNLQDLYIPLATTEGALVASISRGCKVINLSNSLKVTVTRVGISRSLVFECLDNLSAHDFIKSFNKNLSSFISYAESTSNHLKFLNLTNYVRGRLVYLRFSFDTDEAMGMNMITHALSFAWQKEKEKYSSVFLLSLSANVCSDKKVAGVNRMLGRGYIVELDLVIPASIVSKVLKTTTKKLVKTHIVKNLVGSNVAGSMAQNMHVVNALVAVYLATGQDPAHCVAGSEASVVFEEMSNGDCYVSLTLPNVTVGTVGGGTWMDKQTQARNLISNNGKTSSLVLAVVSGIASLAGEISGLASLSANSLARAHQKLARRKDKSSSGV